MEPKNIIEKIWESHIVHREENKPDLLYIDLHLVHEVTSPQAFEGLRMKNRQVRMPKLTFATMDHNVPTRERHIINDQIALTQMNKLRENCTDFQIELADINDPDQGIVHVIGPELGLTQPGKTIVCGDSHTSTHGAFGAIAFGIGTSEVEHVLATQTLWQTKPKTLQVNVTGKLGFGVTAKDLILYLIAQYGIGVGTGHVIEFTGEAIKNLSMEERMTVCNMSIEAGARAGLIGPDEVTFEYLKGREHLPKDVPFEELTEKWKMLVTDEGASYDKTIEIAGGDVEPQVTWGTNPSMGGSISGTVPQFEQFEDSSEKEALKRALQYMDLEPGARLEEIPIDYVFIGSCTNSRLSDLRAAARVIQNQKVKEGVVALVVPGSYKVKKTAEEEGLHKIFQEAGFEWREAGCSMCLAMNDDIVPPGKRCASTSNRNFEGRQGNGSRTHLLSPAMAAAAAINGRLTDVRKIDNLLYS